jgi:hypothetical protein
VDGARPRGGGVGCRLTRQSRSKKHGGGELWPSWLGRYLSTDVNPLEARGWLKKTKESLSIARDNSYLGDSHGPSPEPGSGRLPVFRSPETRETMSGITVYLCFSDGTREP